jgi:GDP-4-dehydro-6-deoxy-D-mannose reductase
VRCLVTGASGFIGGHLIERLATGGHDVHALVRPGKPAPGAARGTEGDVLDRASLDRAVGAAAPDAVFHLAAQSLPVVSWKRAGETVDVNVRGTLNVLDAVRAAGGDPVVVVACSSAEYADEPSGRPIREDGALAPSSPYGVSKLAQDHLARLFGSAHGLGIVRARPFFVIGPRKERDVCSDLARRIVAIERGTEIELPVGNLDVVRDFLDVRDAVAALILLATRGARGEVYNVASGRGYDLHEILALMKAHARVVVKERTDPARFRPMDERTKIGDPARLMALGWKPAHAIEATVVDILEYWRRVA